MPKMSNALREIRQESGKRAHLIVPNWRDEIPKGSQWFPGSLGKPDCACCLGMGWIRQNKPMGDPEFGKLSACQCITNRTYPHMPPPVHTKLQEELPEKDYSDV